MIATTTQQELGIGESASRHVLEIPAFTAHEWVRSGEAVLIDVREAGEHELGTIPGSRQMPLETLSSGAVHEACAGRRAVFICRDGIRSLEGAEAYAMSGCAHGEHAYSVVGGLVAWHASGLPVREHTPLVAPEEVRRVARSTLFVTGALVVLGTVLGALVSVWWLLLSGVMGCGLLVAGSGRRVRPGGVETVQPSPR